MGFWEPRISYREALEELPKLLSILDISGVDDYVFHGRAALIYQEIAKFGDSKTLTKDIDLLVFSNDDVRAIHTTIKAGRYGVPFYSKFTPLFGSLDGEENIGMRGINITFEHGRIEVRNGLYYVNADNSITTGDRRVAELVCLPKEKTGFVCDMNVRLRPYDMVKKDVAAMREFHVAMAEHYGAVESEFL